MSAVTASTPTTTTGTSSPADDDDGTTMTLTAIDNEFHQVGCLGHGGFGTVFLAKKRSGRQVALKFMKFEELNCGNDDGNDDNDEVKDLFSRELDAVLRLEQGEQNRNRDLAIVFFEDWFTGPDFACIVMNYADGGTLAQEIVSKAEALALNNVNANSEPYTERRMASYALQLSEALAFAHERGVAHHDVKSANVLIDRTGGGKLLLADFGSAVAPGEESVQFSEIYAAPELLAAYNANANATSGQDSNDNFSGLEADKIDAFGLGCILFEMLCCKKLVDLTQEQTLAEFIQERQSVDAALDLPCVSLPWIPESPATTTEQPQTQQQQQQQQQPVVVGYSQNLRGLVKTLLEPLPSNRWTTTDLQKPLRQDPLSPLLADFVSAAQIPNPGAPLTIDNVQLGMFVQRGPHWNDGDSDGGLGSVGVVVKLDADAGYTEVAFPSRRTQPSSSSVSILSMCCRIGAGNKFELQVGPTPLQDFFAGTEQQRTGGVIYSGDTTNYNVGQMINSNCMIVSIHQHNPQNLLLFVTPMEKIMVPALPFTLPIQPMPVVVVNPRKPLPPPDSWKPELGLYFEVYDVDEKSLVTTPFYSMQGGLDIQTYEIVSIKRVQSANMWEAYARAREMVAAENWGVVGERRLFHGIPPNAPPEALLSCATPHELLYQRSWDAVTGLQNSSNEICFSEESQFGDHFSFKPPTSPDGTVRQMVLSRVALGRMDDRCNINNEHSTPPPRPSHFDPLEYHSVHKRGPNGPMYTIVNPFQAFPEYTITYKVVQSSHRRRMVRARRLQNNANRPSSSRGARRVPQRPRQQQQQASPRIFADAPNIPSVARLPPVAAAALSTPPAATTSRTNTGESSPKSQTPGSASAAKECVVCLEREVTQVLIPCGHPCLCEICSTKQGLRKLQYKCPECRAPVREAIRFYGKVVQD
jgi:serine/threonine protein kinase